MERLTTNNRVLVMEDLNAKLGGIPVWEILGVNTMTKNCLKCVERGEKI